MKPSTIQITGPLEKHLNGLWSYLLKKGYTPLSIRNFAYVLAHLSKWLDRRRLHPKELEENQIAAFVQYRRRSRYTAFLSRNSLNTIVDYLREADLIPPPEIVVDVKSPIDELLAKYDKYLLQERNIVQATANGYEHIIRNFLAFHFADGHIVLESLTTSDVISFVLRGEKRWGTVYVKTIVTALRSFLGFLYKRGDIAQDLAAAVPSVAGWRLSSLPKAVDVKDIRRLLRSCDRRKHIGRRDYAAILLMVRLGLRACEVATLELDDIDWMVGEVVIHGKGCQIDRLPLLENVGKALAAYVRWSRPPIKSRRVFVSVHAPPRPLTSPGIRAIVRCGCKRAGLAPFGSHRLRHTAATEMLNHGSSLTEIAQVLRHRHLDTTAIYAKVDRTNLRELARPWPGSAK